jgi:hypothetical protein
MNKPKQPKFKKKTYSSRKFLNKDLGLAAIESYISIDTMDGGMEASLDISDCNRKVTLDFYFFGTEEKNIKRRLDKLNLIVEEVTKFRNTYLEFLKESKERGVTYKKYRKQYDAWKKANPGKLSKNEAILEALQHD